MESQFDRPVPARGGGGAEEGGPVKAGLRPGVGPVSS